MFRLRWIIISVFSIVSRCHCYNPSTEDKRDVDLGRPLHTHIFKERSTYSSTRSDIRRQNRAGPDHPHEVIFTIQQKNMDKLASILHDVSDPHSPNYGQHWTRDQVVDFTSNAEGRDAVVSYLHMNGASIVSETLAGEYITAKAPIKVWEKMFNTEFFIFTQTHRDNSIESFIRAEDYWIPRDLNKYIASVFNTIEILSQSSRPISRPPLASKGANFFSKGYGYMTPSKLRAYYNTSTAMGSINSTQAIFAGADQYYSPANLLTFQADHGSPVMPAVREYGNHANDTVCKVSQSLCDQGNLDMQYITTMSPLSPTTYWYANVWFTEWLLAVADSVDPPKVLSISYGTSESSMVASIHDGFTVQAIKLGTMGVTIVVPSGDSGASGQNKCGYAISFPASSPYVLSVGGTTGPEIQEEEVVAESLGDCPFTSGGGFSSYHATPSYQLKHVQDYFTFVTNRSAVTPVPGFNKGGRGYPDVAIQGHYYLTLYGLELRLSSGTSAACPVVAGFISNVNAARMRIGKGSVGFVNPALYAYSGEFTNDVTKGNNRCLQSGACCTEGFTATPGWDPASGLGSLNYAKMEDVFLSLGTEANSIIPPTNSPTYSPSSNPSHSPTSIPTATSTSASSSKSTNSSTFSPMSMPTLTPSAEPTSNPTLSPSLNPSDSPTTIPTATPTSAPSLKPTNSPMIGPTNMPTSTPTAKPTSNPAHSPSLIPTALPTRTPTATRYSVPSSKCTNRPTSKRRRKPTSHV